MIKILGIFAIVLVYYCEINAEIDSLGHGKATTKDVRRNTKKTFSGNYSSEAQRRAKLTTRFRRKGSSLLKFTIKIDETLSNDLGPLVVETRRATNIKNRDAEKEQTEKKDSESNQPKMKMKPSQNPVKLHSINTKPINDDSKDETNKKGKSNKSKTHREKDNEHTEKSINHDKYTNITKESKNSHIIKTKKTEDIHKHNEKMNQAVGKSKYDLKITKEPAALRGNRESQSSNKDTKRSTSTPKQRSKPVRVGVVYKTMNKSKVPLRSHKDGEKIRSTRMIPLAENRLTDEEHHRSGEGGGEKGEGGGEHGEGGGEHGGEGGHKGEGVGHGENVHGQNDHGQNDHSEHGHSEHGHGDESHANHNKKHNSPSYLSPYALMAQMEQLMKEFPHANATVTRFARTVEYNDIVLVSVSEKTKNERYTRAKDSKYIDDAPEKKIIFIAHGLSVMGMRSMTSLIQMSELKLLFSYYFKHLDKFDFFIMPMANPDGYSASRSPERAIWNKNMSPQSVCPGVFVDRNFDIAWNASADISSCSQIFPGATPFSEVESKAVRDVFHYYSHKIIAYIHVHAGTYSERVFKGDAILYPRGYTETQSDDDKYIDLKGEIDEAMKNASFRVISVTVDTLASWYGIVTGSSVDYAAAVFGIPYALEFVMQIYDSESLMNDALTQIWSRLIDTTIVNIWKSLQHNSEERKTH